MTTAPTFTAPPPQRPVRRPTPPAPEPPTRPPLPDDGRRPVVVGTRGKPNGFSSFDPLLWRVGVVALAVAAAVALTAYLLLRLLGPAVVSESGLWSIAAEVRDMITALVPYF